MTHRTLLVFSRLLLLLILPFTGAIEARAQCVRTVSTFPYSEDFEGNDGDWQSGGVQSDWVWGTPNKPVITRAASGVKCWVVGGIQNTRYSDNENSWVVSPCFDFTNLANPYFRCRLFWETEKKYDGLTLEYTTDGGASWRTLGSAADNAACPGNNWFTTSSITALRADGWSGNRQTSSPCPNGFGGGSNAWVTAARPLSGLGGRSNVQLRFRFASGNVCNDYDGVAFDDIWIGELQGANAAFSYSCPASARSVEFMPVSAVCGSTYSWNFGDPATGTFNTSTATNPTHTFSAPGFYTVTLTVIAPDGSTATIAQNIRITQLAPELLTPVSCAGGSDASMIVRVSPTGTYNFSWSTTPAQTTATATGLRAGNYTVEVTAADACANRLSVSIAEPPPIRSTPTVQDARCNGANGIAAITPSGGLYPYSYNWQPGGISDSVRRDLLPGAYQVLVADANGCTDTARFSIGTNNDFSVSLGSDTVLCDGETLLLYPGPYVSYRWQDGRTDTSFLVTQTGDYSVTVTDRFGCTGTARIKVTVDCSDVYFPTAFTPNGDGRNDAFGPLGNRAGLSQYRLRVYGRWGQLVFETTDPFRMWDARQVAGGDGTQVFVWEAQYHLVRRSGTTTRKGTVLVVR